jgi:hypothetical protein
MTARTPVVTMITAAGAWFRPGFPGSRVGPAVHVAAPTRTCRGKPVEVRHCPAAVGHRNRWQVGMPGRCERLHQTVEERGTEPEYAGLPAVRVDVPNRSERDPMSTTRSGLLARTATTLAVGAALVAAPGLATSAAAADAPTTTSERAGLAGSFIATTLVDGDHYDYPGGDWFDGGNTVDAVLALGGAGVGLDTADAAMAYLAANVGGSDADNYIGAGSERYAGPLAKTLVGAVAHGDDPTSFGGVDLVAELAALEGTVEPGRFSDASAYGDYSNTIGQALAVIGLERAGAGASAEAVDFLLAQQCGDGGFRGDPAATGCVSDPDATAFAAQALLQVGATTEAGAALDALAGLQSASGGVAGDGAPENANTTGVAVQAFLAGGRTAAAASGQAFLASLQYDCTDAAPLRWGLAYTDDARSTTTVADSDLRATPQAALALAGGSLLSVSSADSSAGLPTFACTTPTTTTPAPSTTTTSPTAGSGGSSSSAPASPATGSATTSAATGGVVTDDPTTTAAVVAAGSSTSGPTSLARTGSNPLLPLLAGLVLVVVGAAAVWGSRRRGAHA